MPCSSRGAKGCREAVALERREPVDATANNGLSWKIERATGPKPANRASACLAPGSGPLLVLNSLDGDGHPDLAVAGGTVNALLSKGDGTFQDAQSFGVGVGPSFVAVGDFNGDGHLDLVVRRTSKS